MPRVGMAALEKRVAFPGTLVPRSLVGLSEPVS